MTVQQFEVWRDEVEPVLTSKVEEFRLLGYKQADKDVIWQCALEKLKKKKFPVRLHELVNVILNLRLNDYMNQVTIQSYRESSSLSSTQQDLNELIEEVEKNKSNKRHLT